MSELELKDIAFAYPNQPMLFKGVDLTVSSGRRVAICAPSGKGKSTLCRIAAGYDKPSEGRVTFKASSPKASTGASPVQMIWQHPEQALDPLITINSSLTDAGPLNEELLDALGVKKEWLSRYPRELSGGELQRCCIVRALTANPEFIIADELSTMLDAITQLQIWEFLIAYCEEHNIGMLLVTHSDALRERVATDCFDLTEYCL